MVSRESLCPDSACVLTFMMLAKSLGARTCVELETDELGSELPDLKKQEARDGHLPVMGNFCFVNQNNLFRYFPMNMELDWGFWQTISPSGWFHGNLDDGPEGRVSAGVDAGPQAVQVPVCQIGRVVGWGFQWP